MKNLYIAVAVLLAGTMVGRADEKSCLVAAFQDYNKANVAILSQGISIDTRMAQRRLEERYCLRAARCSVDSNQPGMAMPFAVEFYRCLDDEAKERLSHQ